MNASPDPEPPPEWAVAYVRGVVELGMNTDEIQQKLIARGLSPETASQLIHDTLFGRAPEPARPAGEWGKPVRLLIAAMVGAAILMLAYEYDGGRRVGLWCAWVIPALAAIAIPDLTDTFDSEWGQRTWLLGWAALLLGLASRIYLAVMRALAR